MGWNPDAEKEFWRRKCYDSFWWFFRYAWGYDFNPKGAAGKRPWLMESTHREACDWFERHALEWLANRRKGLNKPKRLICVVPRDWGKTTLFAQAGQSWIHLHDRDLATYTGCETITRAREVLNGIKVVVSGDDAYSRYTWLYGNERNRARKWKVDGLVTASRQNLTRRDDSFGTWAVQSGMVGLHPDGGFFDDPNTYERMDRHADWLDIVNSHMSTLIPVFQSDAFWMLTATRYGDGDHIGRSIKNGGVKSMSGMTMPDVKIDPDGIWDVFFLDAIDDSTAERKLVMPHIWSWDRINQFERENSVRFWAQVRNSPSQNPHNILTRERAEKLIVDASTIDFKKLRISLHLDTAFKNPKRKTRGDANVIAAAGHEYKTGRVVYCGARVSTDWDSDGFAENLVETVVEWRGRGARVVCMTDEQDIGGKPGLWPAFLLSVFRRKGVQMPELLVIDRNSKRKEERLAQAAAFWRDGRVVLPRTAPYLDLIIEQMTKIGMTDFDDLSDAFVDAFNKQVYSVVWPANAAVASTASSNPFDDVLKPGPVGDRAAEVIAARVAKQEADVLAFYDVVQP